MPPVDYESAIRFDPTFFEIGMLPENPSQLGAWGTWQFFDDF